MSGEWGRVALNLFRGKPPRLRPCRQRFEITNQAHKIDAPVRYPLEVDMGPYLTDHLEYPASYKP